ncbi:MAG: ABC transporter ATP-binding protein [Candidatus Paceibacterota bacterium]
MAKAQIFAKNLEVTYNEGKSNEFKASRDLNVEIFAGEYIILFGPSGCGKSTLLYSILGALPPSRGQMLVKGDDIYKYEQDQLVNFQRNVIGIMYQAFNLIPSISVLDNVVLPQIFASVDKARRDNRGRDLLRRFGVDHIANKLPTNLSGGQMQRVAVARSLVNDPEILLADEPVGNLDSISAEQVMNTLEQINLNDKKTVILVTHDAKYLPYAHRVYYLRDGKNEREVPNPEKKQIKKVEAGKTITTEIEKLARMYPYSSIEELRVKSLVNYLIEDIDFDQLVILEKAVEDVIKGRMGDNRFLDILNKRIGEGGVGFSKARSEMITKKIFTIMEESRDITRFRSTIDMDLGYYYQSRFVERLKKYTLSEVKIKLSKEQHERLDDFISDRLTGLTRRHEFLLALDKPVKEGGLGLNKKASALISRHIEKLLAQGVSYIIAKH